MKIEDYICIKYNIHMSRMHSYCKFVSEKVGNSHEGPFSWEPRKIEPEKLPLEVVVERDELAVATRAEVPPGHVDVVDDESLAILVDVTVVGHRDGQRALLGVVDARKARSIVCNKCDHY